ncbi:excalibur calcium-binding domain-containing protein [Citricoccus zhacaiensis]|uniref:Excalibur calcium-binding domain-containing protein n=2 Tax=Citricoccus parietis TaxID=592307 RepID=A0ABV6F9K3_9MICC|nr:MULTISPECIES: excalibur calcium-binding domain-containing protein [Citricoccus]
MTPRSPASSPASSTSPPEPFSPFENCTAAREAGAAPVHADSLGYAPHLDGIGDGVGCE